MLELRLRKNSSFIAGAKNLLEVKCLSLINHIENSVWRKCFLTFNNRRNIGCMITGRASRIDQNNRWHVLFVAVAGNIDNPGAIIETRKPASLQIRYERLNQVIDITLAFPKVKTDIKKRIIGLQRRHRNVDEMLQKRPIANITSLHACDRPPSALGISIVIFCTLRRRRVQAGQIIHINRWLLG
ncbi:MAG: Uncharacterised protein [Hyphomonas sp. TMED17]|nr:MAG: Uncharacterised protein [Hyphomonas sp. TMED17]